METSEKIAAVHKYVEAFNTAEMNLIREIYAEDAIVEDPVGSEPHVGLKAVCAFYEGVLSSAVELALTGTPRCAGNAVAFTFQAQMPGMAIEIVDVFEFDELGKVNNMKAYWGPENIVTEQ